MPTYEYKCPQCKEVEEVQRSAFKPEIVKCIKCDISKIMMISKPSGIHFKGSGFYATDYQGK